MRVAILGAGSGAFAAAVDLKLRGFTVDLCSQFAPDLRGRLLEVERNGGRVEYSGVLGEGTIEVATHRELGVVRDTDIAMVVTTAPGYVFYAERTARMLRERHTVFLNPGYLGGGLSFARALRREADGGSTVRICESNNLPYICRLVGPAHVRIFRKSKLMILGSFPSRDGDDVLRSIRELYPQVTLGASVLESGMMNPNLMVHPPGMLLNAGWIEATGGNFLFYNEGCTGSVSRVIEAIDLERLSICRRLNVKTMSTSDYYLKNGYSDSPTPDVMSVLKNSGPNRNIRAPKALDDRYVTEDIPFGLVPMASLGRIAGTPMPITDSLIRLASAAMRVDYNRTGLTSRKMGIAGMDAGQLMSYLESGFDHRLARRAPNDN